MRIIWHHNAAILLQGVRHNQLTVKQRSFYAWPVYVQFHLTHGCDMSPANTCSTCKNWQQLVHGLAVCLRICSFHLIIVLLDKKLQTSIAELFKWYIMCDFLCCSMLKCWKTFSPMQLVTGGSMFLQIWFSLYYTCTFRDRNKRRWSTAIR